MRLGHATTREAISLASYVATPLAPFLTGVMIDLLQGGGFWGMSGFLALALTLGMTPVALLLLWLALKGVACFACRCEPWSVPVLIGCTCAIGAAIALYSQLMAPSRSGHGWTMFWAHATAGALTGAAYAVMIVFWDSLLKGLCEKTNGRLDGRPFARTLAR